MALKFTAQPLTSNRDGTGYGQSNLVEAWLTSQVCKSMNLKYGGLNCGVNNPYRQLFDTYAFTQDDKLITFKIKTTNKVLSGKDSNVFIETHFANKTPSALLKSGADAYIFLHPGYNWVGDPYYRWDIGGKIQVVPTSKLRHAFNKRKNGAMHMCNENSPMGFWYSLHNKDTIWCGDVDASIDEVADELTGRVSDRVWYRLESTRQVRCHQTQLNKFLKEVRCD
jgi:hypothetical protein